MERLTGMQCIGSWFTWPMNAGKREASEGNNRNSMPHESAGNGQLPVKFNLPDMPVME